MIIQRLPSAPPLEVEFLDLLVLIDRHRQPNGYMDASWYVLRRADAFRTFLNPFEKPVTEETLAAHGCPARKAVMTERLQIQLGLFDAALEGLKESPETFQLLRSASFDPFEVLLYFLAKSGRFDASSEGFDGDLYEEVRNYFLLIETPEDVPKAKARFLSDMTTTDEGGR